MRKTRLLIGLILLLPLTTLFAQNQSVKLNFEQVLSTTTDQVDQFFSGSTELYFTFQLPDRAMIHQLTRIISVDNVRGEQVWAYANKKEFCQFLELNIPYSILPHPSTEFTEPVVEKIDIKQPLAWDFYPSYTAYETMMYQFESTYPALCRIINIGTLPSGRKLLVAKISNNVDSAMNKPQFLYTSSMHGDELTGYVLMLRTIDYLLTNYGSDPYLTNIVNGVELYINPLANPDGTYKGGNSTVNQATRSNANNVDLNRNYPDPQGGLHPDGNAWQPETVAFMGFAAQQHFVMAGNFHGGAEVVNYPWDTWANLPADNNWWIYVSRLFADTAQAYSVSGYFNDLDNGITNGYAWYEVEGGRQDYMNWWHHCRESCLEISGTKKPSGSQLPNYWNYLYRSLLTYMEQSMYGIRGIVTDSVTGEPLKARIYIQGHDVDSSEVYSALPVGNYHRLLFPGTYNLTFSSPGYYSKTIHNLSVINYSATLTDVQLVPVWTGLPAAAPAEVRVFPNPASSVVTVQFLGETGNYKVELLNILGEKCLSENLFLKAGSRFPINLDDYPSGLYILKVSDHSQPLITRKILKK